MKRKEAIIRYLGKAVWAGRWEIARATNIPVNLVSVKLTELKKSGLVRRVEWSDGSKVWVLTAKGGKRYEYYKRRDRKQANSRS